MGRALVCMGHKRREYKILRGILEGKSPLRRPQRKLEDNIKMGLKNTI
jgi:hypothetical protein